MLVANKCDRTDKIIETEKGRALAEQHGLMFFETSAKTGHNVNEVFHSIANVIVREKIPQGGMAAIGQNGFANGGAARSQGQRNIKMG